MADRNYNNEYQDEIDRKYAYDFDYQLRDYMIKEFQPLFIKSTDTSGNLVSNALEMGCYKGEFTQKIAPFFSELTVIEGSSDLTHYCKRKFASEPTLISNRPITYINNRFEDIGDIFSFDNIFLIHTLEHLDQPIETLKKVNSWLSKKGRLYLAVPNANAASRQIAVNMGLITHNTAVTEGEKEHGHRCTYNLDTLKRDVKQAGLKIVREGGIFFKPFANFQFDQLINHQVIDNDYLDGCYQLGKRYPDLCASIFVVCESGEIG